MEIPQLSGFMCVSGVMLQVCKANLGLKQHVSFSFSKKCPENGRLCFWSRSKFPGDSSFVMGQWDGVDAGAPGAGVPGPFTVQTRVRPL